MKRLHSPSEAHIAEEFVAMLEAAGWDVYQEVQCRAYGKRADIVGLLNGRSWIVEVKRCATLSVLEQALRWEGAANWISVACGTTPRGTLFSQVCRWKGLGLLTYGDGEGPIEMVPARLSRLNGMIRPIATACGPNHKTYAKAGSKGAGYWTPFAETKRNLRAFVAHHPGCSLKDAVASISHHYSSGSTARSSLMKWLLSGHVPGVRAETDAKPFRLYPDPRPPP